MPLDDEPHTIILNTACEPEKVPEELRAFFAYINDPSKRDGSWLTQAIDERVRKCNTTKWRKVLSPNGERRYELLSVKQIMEKTNIFRPVGMIQLVFLCKEIFHSYYCSDALICRIERTV